MNMLRAFPYRFHPTPEQENLLRPTLGCVRLVHNKALDLEAGHGLRKGHQSPATRPIQCSRDGKKEEDLWFLNEVSSVPLQQTLRNLQTAFSNFFGKRAKYPNFKKKHNGGSAKYTRPGGSGSRTARSSWPSAPSLCRFAGVAPFLRESNPPVLRST